MMLRVTLSFWFCCHLFLSAAQSQTNASASKWVLGGSGLFLNSKNSDGITNESLPTAFVRFNGLNERKSNTLRINTYAGYEVSRHWLLGLVLRSERVNEKVFDLVNFISGETYDRLASAQLWGFGGFVRYTVNPSHALQAFVQPQMQWFQIKEQVKYDSSIFEDFKAVGFRIPIQFGALYAINAHWRVVLLAGSLEYQQGTFTNVTSRETVDYNSLGFNFRPASLLFGAEYRF